jgi:archaellum component FlaC
MRRAVLLSLSLFELMATILLVAIALKLPTRSTVDNSFSRLEGMTGEATKQVSLLRDSQEQVLGSVAQGMEAWANALDPAMIRQLREGTAQLAGFLQEQVGPAAASASGRLEKAIETFQKDALLLSQVLKDAPPDLKAAREMYDSLGRFSEGVERVSFLVSPERLKTMREGFKGMEESLDTGAEQVERLAGYTYPVVKFNGLKPEIDEKSFWPDGEDIAKGMRKGAKAMREAGKEFDTQAANMPHVQRSIYESKKAVGRMREMLSKAVNNQEKLETVLKTLPQNTARLAEELPLLAKDFNRILRETERLSEISRGLKQAQTLLASAEKSWPDARQGLLDSAARLRSLQKAEQNDQNGGTREHKQSLESLGSDLRRIHEAVPEVSRDIGDILTLVRWLLFVLAAALTLHTGSVVSSAVKQQPR